MGGLERNTLTLCSALEDLGNDVQLITETPSDESDDYPFPVIRTHSAQRIFRSLSGADLLIVNGNISLRVHPLAWMRGIPYAVVYHNFLGYRRQGGGLATTLENALRGGVAERAAANIFTNTYAEEHSGLPEDTTHVVFNPVDKRMQGLYGEDCRGSRSSGAPFLFAGRVIEGKGVFVLARALEHLDGELEARVVVAGEGRDEKRLREQVQGLSTVQVDLVGRLDAPELVEKYQEARALLVPSTTHKEGNPLVVAEAIYAGTPVIASDQPPMIESVGSAGMIVERGNAEELAKAIRVLQTEPETYTEKREYAEDRAGLFGYERYRRQIRDIFGRVG
jgi:glycosyltransferase involved in cell wall biosynthesis